MTAWFTSPTKVTLPNATKKQENVLKVTDQIATMDLPEEEKKVMKVLREATNLVCHIHRAELSDLNMLYKVKAGENLFESVGLLPCASAYNVRRQRESDDTSHDSVGPCNMNKISGMA